MTKNTLRVLSCIIIVLVFVFALASCEQIDKIFNKHEHSYTHTVTPPSCESQGYTTHTCECGDSYVDAYVPESHVLIVHEAKEPSCTEVGYDEYFTCRKCDYTTYVEKPALGHKYEQKVTRVPTTVNPGILSTICSECGETTDEQIEAVSVTLPRVAEFIKSFVGMNEISVNADNTEIVFIDEIESDDGVTKRYIAIDLTCFELSGKGEELYAHVTFELGIATLDPTVEGAEPVLSTQMLVDLYATGDDVSVAITEGENLENSDVDLTEEFYGYIAEKFGMTYDELAEVYYIVGKVAEYLPVIEDILESIPSVELPDGSNGLNVFISAVYDDLVSVDDDGYYYIDLAGLVDVLESAKTKTVSQLIDEYFGKGTMTAVETFMLTLPMTKVRVLAKSAEAIAESYNIPVDDVYALINYVVYAATGEDFNIEHEIKVRYNKTVAEVIVELTNQGENVTEADINVMALAMVNEIKNVISLVKTNTLDQLYNVYMYDDAGFDYSFTDEMISKLEDFDEKFDAKWHLSEDGELDAINVVLNGVFGLQYGVIDGDATVCANVYYGDGETLSLSASINETYATVAVLSGENRIIVLSAAYDENALLSAELKLNALYVGALEGYEGEENLLNILTVSYLKGEGSDHTVTLVLNTVTEKEGETPDETVGVYEKVLDVVAVLGGTELVITHNGKITTVTLTETEDGATVHVVTKEAETVISEYTVSIVTALGDDGLPTDVDVTVLGTVDGSQIDMTLDYADGVLSALCKIDGEKVLEATVSLGEDGSIDADLDLSGVNVSTEVITYLKQIIEVIEGLGVLENLPEVAPGAAA